MKKILIIVVALSIISVAVESASAWHTHPRGHSHFGVFIGPPVIFIPPPPVRYHTYYPPYDYYDWDYRVWVPGHWEYRRSPYGWERVWIPGRWEWRQAQ